MIPRPPTRVKPRVIKGPHRYVAAVAREALRPDRAACPSCEAGSLQPTNDDEVRCCDHCGTIVTLDDLAILNGAWLDNTAPQRRDYFQRHARLLVQVACLFLALAAALSSYAGSPDMLFAAASLIPVFLAGIFAMRYRAWQAATGRVYETKAPFGDFMRDELRSLTGGRG